MQIRIDDDPQLWSHFLFLVIFPIFLELRIVLDLWIWINVHVCVCITDSHDVVSGIMQDQLKKIDTYIYIYEEKKNKIKISPNQMKNRSHKVP